MKRLGIYIDSELFSWIAKQSKKEGVTDSAFVRWVLLKSKESSAGHKSNGGYFDYQPQIAEKISEIAKKHDITFSAALGIIVSGHDSHIKPPTYPQIICHKNKSSNYNKLILVFKVLEDICSMIDFVCVQIELDNQFIISLNTYYAQNDELKRIESAFLAVFGYYNSLEITYDGETLLKSGSYVGANNLGSTRN